MVYTNKTPITRAVIDACPALRAISVLTTGYNVGDYEYAARKGILTGSFGIAFPE